MRGVFVLVCICACSGSHLAGGDGGVGGDVDAGIDAMPDAPACPSGDDRDGDGICDVVDKCPDIADPGQVDLDGDGVGWMCDPVESVTMDSTGFPGLQRVALHRDTFAARTRIGCSASDACENELLQVGPTGSMLVRADSANAADAWQAFPAVRWVEGPYITKDDRVLWSRGYENGDTGDFDLATRQYTPRDTGVFDDSTGTSSVVLDHGALVAASLETASLTSHLVDVFPGGTLASVAAAQSFAFEKDALALPGPGGRAIVPLRESFTSALRIYTHGAAALADIIVDGAPLANLGEVEVVQVDLVPRAYCVTRGAQTIIVDWDNAGTVAAHVMPFDNCSHIAGTDRGAARFYVSASQLAYVYGGDVHPLSGPITQLVGAKLPLFVTTFDNVWLIKADGSSQQLLAPGYDSPIASLSGDVINVFAHRQYPGHTDGYGTYDLIRFRGTEAPVSVTIFDNTANSVAATLVTSVEGAAFISQRQSSSFIVPSNTMTPIASPVGFISGGVRAGRTVILANAGEFVEGGVYLYDETTGSPRFTPLTALGMNMQGGLVDATSSWFTYGNDVTGCHFARVTAAGTLDSIACHGFPWTLSLGVRADGTMMMRGEDGVYALSEIGATKVGSRLVSSPIVDDSVVPPVLVGWMGDAGSNEGFACLAMHPERCWNFPVTMFFPTATFVDASGDGWFALVIGLQDTIDHVTVEVVRSIGPGTFAP